MSITFVSFGNPLYYASLERLKKEVQAFPFTECIFVKDTDLMEIHEFWDKHSKFILENKRGYGYWIWKSFITLYIFELLLK